MPDDKPDGAEIHSRISLVVEERRLQDCRWEHDLVVLGVVVRVYHLGRQVPLAAIDWLPDLVQSAPGFGVDRAEDGAGVRVANLNSFIAAPPIRIPDLDIEVSEFLQCPRLRLGRHPAIRLEPRPKSDDERFDERGNLLFGLRRKVFIDVELANSLTQEVACLVERSFLEGTLFLHAPKHAALEGKSRGTDILAEEVGKLPQDLELDKVLDHVERCGTHNLCERL